MNGKDLINYNLNQINAISSKIITTNIKGKEEKKKEDSSQLRRKQNLYMLLGKVCILKVPTCTSIHLNKKSQNNQNGIYFGFLYALQKRMMNSLF